MNEYFFEGKERIAPPTDWIFVVFLIVAVLLFLSRLLFPKFNSRINLAFFNEYEGIKLMAEKSVLFPRESYIASIIPLFNLSLLVLQQIGWFNPGFILSNPVWNYLKVFVLVLSFYAFRLFFVWLTAWLMGTREIGLRFNQVWLVQWLNFGTYSFIPAFMVPFLYGQIRIIALIVIWLAILFWHGYTIFKEIRVLLSYRISLFYLILYLCTLEILPLWWAVKTVMQVW
jgi:hypothetical protein